MTVAIVLLWLKTHWVWIAAPLVAFALIGLIHHAGYADGVKHEAGKTAQAVSALNLCSTALDRQNALARTQAASDAVKLKDSTTTTTKTLKSQSATPAKVKKALAPPKGPTLLDRYEDVDKRVLEAVQ